MKMTEKLKIFRGRLPSKEKQYDWTPLAMPANYRVPKPLTDVIASMVQSAIQAEQKEEFETQDEADDFDMDDDELLDLSPYELTELHEHENLTKPVVRAETQQEAPQEEITPPEDESPEQVEKQVHASPEAK